MSELEQDPLFMTAPLEGLCPSPMHLMSEEELRAYVVKIRQLRTSHQSFRAEMSKVKEKVDTSILDEFTSKPAPKKKVLDEFSL